MKKLLHPGPLKEKMRSVLRGSLAALLCLSLQIACGPAKKNGCGGGCGVSYDQADQCDCPANCPHRKEAICGNGPGYPIRKVCKVIFGYKDSTDISQIEWKTLRTKFADTWVFEIEKRPYIAADRAVLMSQGISEITLSADDCGFFAAHYPFALDATTGTITNDRKGAFVNRYTSYDKTASMIHEWGHLFGLCHPISEGPAGAEPASNGYVMETAPVGTDFSPLDSSRIRNNKDNPASIPGKSPQQCGTARLPP